MEIINMKKKMGFSGELKIYPSTLLSERPKTDLECGGKIILPPSVLDIMTTHSSAFSGPMIFKISCNSTNKYTHCGVLEFIADEGIANAPTWVMDHLESKCGDVVYVRSVSLPKATFSRFQPQSTDFLDISDPKAVLENHLRDYTCLTCNDIIPIFYNNKQYHLKVEETKPAEAVCINECDMNVDFSAPVGYVEPTPVVKKSPVVEEDEEDPMAFKVFGGVGKRLDGKELKPKDILPKTPSKPRIGIPDYNYKFGTIEFSRNEPELVRPSSSKSSNYVYPSNK